MPKSAKLNVKEKVVDNLLDLSLTELKEIPVKEIISLKRVNALDLSNNRLLSLGNNFCTLTHLVKLDLSKNQIKFLPEDFGLLRNLRHLNLYNNQLEHLPLSFGDLSNLRYLDLKGNPLTPALAKVVGICTTTKDCQDSAKRTVKFMSAMHKLALQKANELSCRQEELENQIVPSTQQEDKPQEEIKQKSKKKNKAKSKSKKKSNQNLETTTNATKLLSTEVNITITKANKPKKLANGSLKTTNKSQQSSTALTSLIIFLLLVAFNIVLLYMIMFKKPEIAEKIVESIPYQYRDWILTKTEIFRLRVTDWISEFRTPPEEH